MVIDLNECIFVLRLSVILRTGILMISSLSSLPRLSMNIRRNVGVAAAAAGVAGVSIAACGVTAPGDVDVEAAPRAVQIEAGGNALYNTQCIACHGPEGRGMPGLGVALAGSAFVSKRSAEELVAFLKAGRMPDDPDSVWGRPMPGFAWVSEEELAGVVDYLKAL